MSYQVIARKWRPPTFKELIGQDHVSQTLLNALKSGRLPHALLFTGPRGVGKTSSARILAKSLKCPNAKNFAPCNECKTCEEISRGSSLDVLEIDGASHNGVEAIRELRETVAYMPAMGKYKIYIIDEVHMLSTSAFNALLKTLEEPPAHVIFIFATTEVQKIPVTILSRCQRFDFRRIPTRMIMEHLQVICEKENVKTEPEALWLIARQADGSSRDSQSLLDQIITFSDGKITLQKTIEVLGLTDRALLLETMECLVGRQSDLALKLVERLYFSGCDPKVFLQELIEEIRHLLIIKMSSEQRPAVVDLPDSEIDHLRNLAGKMSEEDIHLIFDMALKGSQDFLRAQDSRLVLEMLLLRMSSAPRIESLFQWKTGAATATETASASSEAVPSPVRAPLKNSFVAPASTAQTSSTPAASPQAMNKPAPPPPAKFAPMAIPRPGGRPTEAAAPRPTPTPQATPAASPFAPKGSLADQWNQFVMKLKMKSPMIAAKLEHVAPLSLDGDNLTIGVSKDKKFLCDELSDAKTLKDLEGHISALWGKNYFLKCQILEGGSGLSPVEVAQKKQTDMQLAIKQEVESHPMIQKAQKTFNAKIKSVKNVTPEE